MHDKSFKDAELFRDKTTAGSLLSPPFFLYRGKKRTIELCKAHVLFRIRRKPE